MAGNRVIERYDNKESYTRNELDKLKDIIRNKHDNVKDLSKLENHKNHEKIKYLDLASEALFDFFVIENWNAGENLKSIIGNKTINSEDKTKQIHKYFQIFLQDILDDKIDISQSSQDMQLAVSSFKTYFEIINKEKKDESKTALELTDLELQLLQDEIITLASTPDFNSDGLGRGSRVSSQSTNRISTFYGKEEYDTSDSKKNSETSKNKSQETSKDDGQEPNMTQNLYERLLYRKNEDYVDPYKTNHYINNGYNPSNTFLKDVEDIEDIYNDKRISKVLAKIFGKNSEELKKRHFEINLGIENGLARIILNVQEYIEKSGGTINKNNNTIKGLFGDILEKIKQEKDPNYTIGTLDELKVEDTKKILEILKVPYEKDGLFGDFTKLTKIFNEAKREDLITFANLVQSRTNIARATKEWFNTKTILDGDYINETNVFEFLSDFNSDGVVSADKNKKNKEQFKVGDVGNISGQQLLFTLEQAEKTQDALLGAGKGEGVVVKNITRMISLMIKESKENPEYLSNYSGLLSSFKDTFSEELINQINTLFNNPNPTKRELVDLLKKFPASKVFFLAAVEKITGGSYINQADLYDVLTGQEGKRLQQIDSIKEMEDLRRKLDIYIQGNSELKKFVNEYGAVELRETMLQRIMDVVDNIGLQVSFDAATEQDMIMSSVNKTFYREQAKKKILGEFNIQNISIGTNLTDLKLSYQIGNGYISSDGRSKYHIARGPSFYLGKNGISGGIDINFSRAEQINYAKVCSASLDAVQKAKYLGAEGGAGVKAGTKGIGLYAALGASYEKDPLMGIMQLEKTYQATSNRIFDISGITSFTKNGIQSHLEGNLDSLQKGIYKDFIKNNIHKLKENIRFVVNYLEKSGLLREINTTYKTSKDKEAAIGSLLRIIQQGNIDQWKGDIIMNLNGKLDLTRFSAGVTAGTRFFGTKSNYTGNSTSGEGDGLDGQTDGDIPFEEGGSTTGSSGSGGNNRIGFLGVYVSARISTWKNTYLPNSKQFLATEQEMNKGIIDHVDAGKDLDKYVLYLEGLFNKTKTTKDANGNIIKKGLIIEKLTGNNEGKIQISYKPISETEEDIPLHKLLNIHYLPKKGSKTGADEQFIYTNNTLIIGNVGPIAAYTTTLPGGVDRVLCLGTKNLNEATRLTGDNKPQKDIQKIEFKENGFEYLSKDKIDQTIDTIAMGTTPLAETEKMLYKSLFDSEGKLLSHSDVTLNSGLTVGQQFSTGTITLYKKSDKKYILDYQSSPTDKLSMEYKTIGTNQNTILKNIQNPDLSDKLNINFPTLQEAAQMEHDKTGKLLPAFGNFQKAIINGNFDEAVEQLSNLPIRKENLDMLKNGTEDQKQYIVDTYISLFAYENVYKDAKLNSNIFKRGDLFTEIYGPSNDKFETNLSKELITERNKFFGNNKDTFYKNLQREKEPNVFGYTAFYRSGLEKGQKGYAATRLGETNIVTSSIKEISHNQQQNAKKWIADNLNNDPRHKKLLVKQIQKAINNSDFSKHIDENNVIKLIIEGRLEIPNTAANNPIDISNKIIKLDSKAIFYLLGECLNESVGLKIENIEVIENLDTYKAEATPDKKYTSHLFGRSNSISGEIQSERNDLSLTKHKKIKSGSDKQKGYTGKGEGGESDDLIEETDPNIDFEDK